MRYFLIIAGAFVLGGYSVLGLHHYSLLQSRIKSIWIRVVLFNVVIALFIFLPMIGFLFLLGVGPVPP